MERALVGVAVLLASLTALPYLGAIVAYLRIQPWDSPAEKRRPNAGDEPDVSVILPTYNEAALIEDKLEELCALDYPATAMEIVVVDDSEDDTADRALSFFETRAAPSLTVIERDDRGGVASGINEAATAATGEILFRTDVDSTLGSTAISEAVANLSDPSVGAVTGRQTAVIGDSATEEEYRDALARLQALESRLDSTFILHGPCSALRREAFTPIAPDAIADDTAMGVSARRRGYRVLMEPRMEFAEAGVSGLRARRRRKDRRAMGLVQALLRNRDALGRYGRYGRLVLPLNWWVMIVSPWLLAASTILGTIGLLLWVGPIGIVAPGALAGLALLGSRDRLGPVQPVWTFLDAQLSLLVGTTRLLRHDGSGTWTVDRDSRDVFESGDR